MQGVYKPIDHLDQFQILQHLGNGYHSIVKLGRDKNTGKLVAIKKYKKQTATIQVMRDQVSVMKKLKNHPNIVKLIHWRENATYIHDGGLEEKCFAMIMEYCSGGELQEYIVKTGTFSEQIIRKFFNQMMNALHFMHQTGYVHRDLKPKNIMLTKGFIVKIVDFGFSCHKMGHNGNGKLNTRLGTPTYMAPEISKGSYNGTKTDVYAAGVILFQMYSGRPPFDNPLPSDPYYRFIAKRNYQSFWKFHQKNFGKGFFSESFKTLINQMIAFNPEERLSIFEIAKEQWVKGPCQHQDVINKQFIKRKKLVAEANEMEIQKQKKMEVEHTHHAMEVEDNTSNTRGSSCPVGLKSDLLKFIREEMDVKRQLKLIGEPHMGDIVLKKIDHAYALARLRHFLKNVEIDPMGSPLEPINYDEVPLDQLLRLHEMDDKKEGEIEAEYHYVVEFGDDDILQKLKVRVEMGKDEEHNVVLRVERVEGDEICYRRLKIELKKAFAHAIARNEV